MIAGAIGLYSMPMVTGWMARKLRYFPNSRNVADAGPILLLKLLHWIDASLSRKYITGMSLGLIATVLAFSLLFAAMYQGRLREQRTRSSAAVNLLMQTAIENAMLKQDLGGVQDIISGLGRQPGITAAMILDPLGQVRFAADTGAIGRHFQPGTDAGCRNCHANAGDSMPTSLFFTDQRGIERLRSITPIANREACTRCHGEVAKHPYNGILVVDYDAHAVRSEARDSTLLLMAAGAVVLLITLLGGWWFMGFFVLRPVRALERASEAMTAGRLDARVAPRGRDELAGLGRRFDTMASSLQQSLSSLEAQGAFLQGLIDAIPDGIRVIGPDFETIVSNRAFRRQLGLDPDQALSEPCYRSSHGRDQACIETLITCPVHELRNSDTPIKCLQCQQRVDGSKLEVEIFAAPMVIERDGHVTRLVVESVRDLEQQVQFSQQQRLSDLGQLAAGVAHEIRNPLSSIHLALQSLLKNVGDQQRIEHYLKLVDGEIDKCIQVNERLLALGSPAGSAPQLLELNTAASETASLLNFEADSRGITLELDLDPCGPRVIADDGEIRQIVLNLVQNAFHALPNGGTVRLSTRCEGVSVSLRVSDDGPGVPMADRQRIFQPFFSRRLDGKAGTGLGLAIVRSLVTRHRGCVDIDSPADDCATFVVTLPNPDQ